MFSLRTRIMLVYAILIVGGFAGLALLAGREIETASHEDFDRNIEDQVTLVAHGLGDPIEEFMEGEQRQSGVENLLATYGEQIGTEITLIDLSGRAWANSQGVVPTGDFRSYPEVVAALDSRTLHDTRLNDVGDMTVFAAAPILHDGQVLSVAQIAVPAAGVEAAVRQRWLALGLGGLGLTLLVLLASIILSSSLTHPIEQLRSSALRVSEGDFALRLPDKRHDEIGQLAQAFNHMAVQVEAMLEEQKAFASNAAHELRTPLTTIRIRSEALLSGSLDDATHSQYIQEIDSEVRRLGSLVDDLILLSRLDAHRAELGREQINMVRFARSLLKDLSDRAAQKDITLILDTSDDLPAVVQASLSHLRVVFNNLLDNAIKYSPDGSTITWSIRIKDSYVESQVSDTGQGIAPGDLPHLFKRFYRADKARTRTISGSGLGLSLVRSIVQFYGGTLSIDSPGIGEGTTVSVRWPMVHSEE